MGTETVLVLIVLGSVFIIAAFVGELPKKFVILEFDESRKFTSVQRFIAVLLGIGFYASIPILSAFLRQPSPVSTPTQIAVVNTSTSSFTATFAPTASNTPTSLPTNTATSTATDTLTPAFTLPPAPINTPSDVLYSEDFSVNELNHTLFYGTGEIKKIDGVFAYCNIDNGEWGANFITNVDNYMIQARFRVIKFPASDWSMSLYARQNLNNQGYAFILNPESLDVVSFLPNKVLGGHTIKPQKDTWYTLALEVNGNNINAYLDNTPIVRVHDNSYKSGAAGISIINSKGCITDIVIRSM